jgi:hypothetical protein
MQISGGPEMSELKTKVSKASVAKYLVGIPDEAKRHDTRVIVDMLRRATRAVPKMWGDSIIGFGAYHYRGKSGREGDWFLAGVSPRKQTLTLYMLGGWEHETDLLAKLGKHTLGKGCLYFKRLEDVDQRILKRLIAAAFKRAKKLAQVETWDRA